LMLSIGSHFSTFCSIDTVYFLAATSCFMLPDSCQILLPVSYRRLVLFVIHTYYLLTSSRPDGMLGVFWVFG
jgi:hypothetical protein